jgi:protein-tyrosine phosphatase
VTMGYGIDANMIKPNLWQGSLPPEGSYLSSLGFDVVVFCAQEYQPRVSFFPDIEVIHAPNDDDSSRSITQQELSTAARAAKKVVRAVNQGKKVLVTCLAGRNRSGLVVALALHQLTGMSGEEVVTYIKERRPYALTNSNFVDVLSQIKATV